MSKPEFRKRIEDGEFNEVMAIEKFILTVVNDDTAYRELFNLVMYHIAIEMNKAHPQHIEHVMYKSKNIDDIDYYMVMGRLQFPVVVEIDGKKVYFEKNMGVIVDKIPDDFSMFSKSATESATKVLP